MQKHFSLRCKFSFHDKIHKNASVCVFLLAQRFSEWGLRENLWMGALLTQLFWCIVPMAFTRTGSSPKPCSLFKTPFSICVHAGGGPQKYTRSTNSARHQTAFAMLEDDREKRRPPARPPEQKRRQSQATITQKRAPVCSVTQQKSRVEKCQPAAASQASWASFSSHVHIIRREKEHTIRCEMCSLFIYLVMCIFCHAWASESRLCASTMQIRPK